MKVFLMNCVRAVLQCAVLALPIVVFAISSSAAGDKGPVQAMRQADASPQMYVEIIIKACPSAETPLEPTNQDHSYDDDKPKTLEERKAYSATLGCLDVPIPPEWMTRDMTYADCKGQAGYLASIQFLEQRQDLKAFPAVGYWVCVPHAYPAEGVSGT